MKILVCLKQILDPEIPARDFRIDPVRREAERDAANLVTNIFCENALETALQFREHISNATITVLCYGPATAEDSLRKALAMKADAATLVMNDGNQNPDPLTVARVLAAAVRREAPDLLFAGVQSSDQSFASTGIATAAFLNWPHAAVVSQLAFTPGAATAVFRRELEGGLLQEVEIQCPAVLTIQLGINTPRYASLRSIKQAAAKPIDVVSLADLGLGAADVGEAGSASRVRRMFVPDKGHAELIEGGAAAQAARLASIIREFKGGST